MEGRLIGISRSQTGAGFFRTNTASERCQGSPLVLSALALLAGTVADLSRRSRAEIRFGRGKPAKSNLCLALFL
jgi:hypothetical protein